MNKKNICGLFLVLGFVACLCAISAQAAALLEVGPGKTYTTIQAAVNAAVTGDEIKIYAGTYVETVTLTNKNYLYIHANGTDRVTLKGGFSLYNPSSATWSDNNLIEGIFVDKTGAASGWAVTHQYARNNEYRNCIFYGDNSGACGIYGYLEYGLNIARHCTFYGLNIPSEGGYASGLHFFDSIVAFNSSISYNSNAGAATYSDFYHNPTGPGLPTLIGSTTGTIYVDPLFISTDPYSPNFLAPSVSSPCKGTASDGNDMGASPRAPVGVQLTVGPGKQYPTIQQAVNACTGGEVITVYAGNYQEDVTIDVSSGTGPLGIALRVNDGDIVVLKGGFILIGSSSPLCEGIVISGFYIDKRGAENNSWGIHCTYARNNTFKNCVIFAEGLGTGGSGIYGTYGYGLNTALHCTLVGLTYPYSNGYGSGLYVVNSIVAFNDSGAYNYPGYSGAAKYSDFYNNPGVSGLPYEIGDTTGTINADPAFVSTTVYCSNFLWLTASTSPCIGTASDGGNMGALPATASSTCLPDMLSTIPAAGESMPRAIGNVIKIVESNTIPAISSVPLKITKLGTLTDVGSNFTYSLATTTKTNDTLIATENGQVLQDNAWYRIEPVGDWSNPFSNWSMAFEFDAVALIGDIDRNTNVNFSDMALLASQWTDSGSTLGNVDLNADNKVGFSDFALLGSNWTKQASQNPWVDVNVVEYSGNPILTYGVEPSGPATVGNLHVCVRKKNASSPYMMWYSGDTSDVRRIYLATSTDGMAWTKQGQVLSESGKHTMMPSVLWDASANLWKAWYTSSSGSGPYSIFYATSPDGTTWTKYVGNPVFGPNTTPGSWDVSSVREPAVIYDSAAGLYKMWYWGNNNGGDPNVYGVRATGYATSPNGINWTRIGKINSTSNMTSCDVLKLNGFYYMFANIGPHIGYAVSLDGITWQDDENNPLIRAATGSWNASYIQASSILYDSAAGLLRIYYNGGNYSLPSDGTTVGLATTPFVP